jgi:hypothetical protein
MILEDYGRQIDEFERVLQKFASDITSGAVFERLPPLDLWSRAETPVTNLKNLAEALKKTMLILKPEKYTEIENSHEALVQPLSAFKDVLFQKTADPSANSRLALEQLRKAMIAGSDLVVFARNVQKNPSPLINEILCHKEVYQSKEYLSIINVPGAFEVNLRSLLKSIEDLLSALDSLEKAMDGARKSLTSLREESLRFHSAPLETSEGSKEKEGQSSLSEFSGR